LRSSALVVSNVFFFGLADYFLGMSDLKPLLHTWSLSIEEQFYFVWPMSFWAIARWCMRWLLPVTALVAVFSLAALVTAFGHHKKAAFFLSPFRIWELALGASLTLLRAPQSTSSIKAEIAAGAGLILIVATAVLADEAHAFSGRPSLLGFCSAHPFGNAAQPATCRATACIEAVGRHWAHFLLALPVALAAAVLQPLPIGSVLVYGRGRGSFDLERAVGIP
jgi:peptidoglycan/LPS O-acetylase OafA/YrhL